MSDIEKAIEQKLADARAQSDKNDAKPAASKPSDPKKATTGPTAKKDDGKTSTQKPTNAGTKPAANAKKVVAKPQAGATVKKVAVKSSPQKVAAAQSGTTVKKAVAKPATPKAANAGAPVKKVDGKTPNQKAPNAGSQTSSATKKSPITAPNQKTSAASQSGPASKKSPITAPQSGSNVKKVVAGKASPKKVSTSGPQTNSATKKDEGKSEANSSTKSQSGSSNETKKTDAKSSSEASTKPDAKDRKVSESDGQRDKKKDDKSSKSNGDSKEPDASPKNDDEKDSDRRSRKRSQSRTSRDRSRSPMTFKRTYGYHGTHYDPNYHLRKFDRRDYHRRSPDRRRSRSPDRRRTRSPLPPRRRSRSPYRRGRSPSPRRHDSRRRSRSRSRRRSRSPRRRTRSRSRSRRDRSRSRERSKDPKALIAKKSFLDDLAVKFAQEGKEFPELEQYRCEINSQFIQYPQSRSQFSRNAVEHSFASNDPFMDMAVCPPAPAPMGNPIVMADPYNAYPLFAETPALISYPIQSEQPPVMHSPALDSPQPSMSSQFKQDTVSVADTASKAQRSGTQPFAFAASEIWSKLEAKIRVKQAINLLDDIDSREPRTGKFLYRAPTYYGKGINEDRSPLLKSERNPIFEFNRRSADESSDPFGNIPRKLKAVVDILRMDEGDISHRILQRQQQKQQAVNAEKIKQQAEERVRRQQSVPAAVKGASLQKTTQTDPTVCTDCLLRKIKVRYNGETQTDVVRTVDSVAQTNPMPVQAVSEFGSITELTPNQVRAVSELIKYIKLTVTSGTLTEMRDSLREDQVFNLNSDLQTAYDYFDAMVEQKNPRATVEPVREVEKRTFDQTDEYQEPDTFIEDENFADEYEELHKNFRDDEDDEGGDLEAYNNPLLQSQPATFHRNVDTRDNYAKKTGNSGGNYGGPSRGAFHQKPYGQGSGRGKNKGSHYGGSYNRRN